MADNILVEADAGGMETVFSRQLKSLVPAILFIAQAAFAQETVERSGGCYSIVVGRNVSADGWVMMAHNEDDYIPQLVNHHKVPRMAHAPDEIVQLDNGGAIPQVPKTWAYIWSEIPGLLFSDSYLNEWGVCICSDACPSREDQPELTAGGITSALRRIVAERATTARHGVRIAGELVERFGYASSGRTYIISDPNEGWLFCAVNGKHWVAQRVPDNQVALIANTYTVREINLADTLNYLGTTHIIDYAVQRGWYDPKTDGVFDFAQVYADSETAVDERNIGRQWDGIRRVAAEPPASGERLPFSVKPKGKIAARDLMGILRSHYEETKLYAVDSATGCPHGNRITPICRHDTQTSFIAQLRGNMPNEIGLVYWVCLSSPCASCYIPFHFGLDSFPAHYSGASAPPTEEAYQAIVDRPFAVDQTSAFWTFTSFRHLAEQHAEVASRARRLLDAVESGSLAEQPSVEAQTASLFEQNRKKALQLLADYSNETYAAAVDTLRRVQLAK